MRWSPIHIVSKVAVQSNGLDCRSARGVLAKMKRLVETHVHFAGGAIKGDIGDEFLRHL